MKRTTKQLRNIIREELNEIYKGKLPITFYAPGPVTMSDREKKRRRTDRDMRIPRETGAYALPSEDPYDQLDPMVKDTIPPNVDDGALAQAYELSDSLGTKPDDELEDFVYGTRLFNDPNIARMEAIDQLQREINILKGKGRARYASIGRDAEFMDILRKVRNLKIRRMRLLHADDMEGVYDESGYDNY